jgi:putative ABC transport system substrate-binding protein
VAGLLSSTIRGVGRREFISLLAGAALAWPLAARAQQPRKLPTIGYIGSAANLADSPRDVAFQQRLRELGWSEGSTVAIEYRWAENRGERYAEIAAEFVRLKVDIIVTFGTAVPALKQATSVIPIVFALDADPVGRGLVASLARPGGNVTGLSAQSTDLVGKRLELLCEVLPGLGRLAVLADIGFPGAVQEMGEVKASAGTLGIKVATSEIRRAEDIIPAFDAINGRADALYVCGNALTFTNRIRISTLAQGARLPTIHGSQEYVRAGGLMSYGSNFPDLWRHAAEFADKILRGAKPADMPVEQPTKFDLVVNLTTAKALGLKIPEAFLLRADEVIE